MDPGDPDEPSREELESRVAELEQTVSKMLPDRRGVLKGLGAAAIGAGVASSGASGQSAAGQVGTESEPVDVEGAQGNFDSVSTKELGGESVSNHGLRNPNGRLEAERAADAGSIANQLSTTLSGDIDLFIAAGQSNITGVGGDPAAADFPPAGVAYSVEGGTVVDINNSGSTEVTGSCLPMFAQQYNAITGRDVAVLQLGNGGSAQVAAANPSENWDPSDSAAPNLYSQSISDIDGALSTLGSAGYTPNLAGILWSQGEEDILRIDDGTISVQDYAETLAEMIRSYRDDLDAPNLRYHICRTGEWDNNISESAQSGVRNAQNAVAAIVPNTYMVFEKALEYPSRGLMDDNVHYDQVGLNLMGEIAGRAVARITLGDVLPRLRRGQTEDHDSYVGLNGALSVDTNRNVPVVHDGETAGGHAITHPKLEARATAQSLGGSLTRVDCDPASDPYGDWDDDNNQFVVSEPGEYLIRAQITFSLDLADAAGVRLEVDYSSGIGGNMESSGTSYWQGVSWQKQVDLSEGDTVFIRASQNSGTQTAIQDNAGYSFIQLVRQH